MNRKKGISLVLAAALLLCTGATGLLSGCSGDSAAITEGLSAGTENDTEDNKEDGNDWTSDLPDDGVERTGMTVTEDVSDVHSAVISRSLELFKRMISETIHEGKNAMVSPFSILTALTMVEAGAEGETLAELEDSLGWTAEEYEAWLSVWNSSLSETDSTRLNVANSFWHTDQFAVSESYQNQLKTAYQASVRPSAFDDGTVQEVNNWCKEETFGMIPEVIQKLEPEAVFLLLNAVAFEGLWEEEYAERQIDENGTFITEAGQEQQAVMLSSKEDIYLENDMATGFLKPYKDGYRFLALLPKEGTCVSDLMENLDRDAWFRLFEEAAYTDVQVKIPEFTSWYKAEGVEELLKEMGICRIFDEYAAELSGMGHCTDGANVYINTVIHGTFIELNRQGTRAAAVTVMPGNGATSIPAEPKQVYLDRPFVYAIIDEESKLPLFIGVTMNMEG